MKKYYTKNEVHERIHRKMEHWQVPRHKYELVNKRGKVTLRLLNKAGVEEVDLNTNLGSSVLDMDLQQVEIAIRRSTERLQTDIEDFVA